MRLLLASFMIASFSTAAAPVAACSVALGKHQTTAEYRSAKLKRTKQVRGVFVKVDQSLPGYVDGESDLQLVGPTIRGIIRDPAGKTISVRFIHAGLVNDTACGIFQLPENGARGLFYLKRRVGGGYQLLHWQSNAGD